MNLFGLTFDSVTCGVAMSHSFVLVGLSLFIAGFSSFCSLDMAERMRASEGANRRYWLGFAGLALGAGIWSMHFVAMVALNIPLEQGYEPVATIISGIVAVIAVIAGLAAMGRNPTIRSMISGGVIVGAGVVVMHYLGMSALRLAGEVIYRPTFFSLSIVIALTAAVAALWLAANVQTVMHRAGAACVMAVAICGMHYTGMAGTVIVAAPVQHTPDYLVSKEMLAIIVALGMAGLLITGLVLAHFDRKLNAAAVDEAARLRLVNAELEEARQKAEAAAKAEAQFLATMSHEIRTPMNGVIGMIEGALAERSISPDVRDYLVTARESANGLLRILNDILDYSKLEAGQLSIETAPASLPSLVDEIISSYALGAKQKGLKLVVEIDDELPEWVACDALRIKQMLMNFVGNAVKFTATGQIDVSVRRIGKDDVRIEVHDTGVGFDEETRQRLFKRFVQADASTTRKFGGTGLGLAICRELAVSMGGDVGCTSMPGEGSVFWMRFPAPTAAAPAFQQDDRKVDVVFERPLRILVAEDNPVNQKVVRVLLGHRGHDLAFADNGVEAVAMIQERAFDMVFMDVHMPVMDGLEATACIRQLDSDLARIPVIALTANAMSGDREAYLEAGMDDYVAKPLQVAAMLAAIARNAPASVKRSEVVSQSSAQSKDPANERSGGSLADLIGGIDGIVAGFKAG